MPEAKRMDLADCELVSDDAYYYYQFVTVTYYITTIFIL